MTKKDFKAIADLIRDTQLRKDSDREMVANAFADWLATTNPRFDRARFLAACGVAS